MLTYEQAVEALKRGDTLVHRDSGSHSYSCIEGEKIRVKNTWAGREMPDDVYLSFHDWWLNEVIKYDRSLAIFGEE